MLTKEQEAALSRLLEFCRTQRDVPYVEDSPDTDYLHGQAVAYGDVVLRLEAVLRGSE